MRTPNKKMKKTSTATTTQKAVVIVSMVAVVALLLLVIFSDQFVGQAIFTLDEIPANNAGIFLSESVADNNNNNNNIVLTVETNIDFKTAAVGFTLDYGESSGGVPLELAAGCKQSVENLLPASWSDLSLLKVSCSDNKIFFSTGTTNPASVLTGDIKIAEITFKPLSTLTRSATLSFPQFDIIDFSTHTPYDLQLSEPIITLPETQLTCGDLNDDGTLTDADIELIRGIIRGEEASAEEFRRADTDGNGVVAANDINWINYLGSTISTLNCAEASCDVLAWYPDADGDGFGNPAYTPQYSCEVISGHADNKDDCVSRAGVYDDNAGLKPSSAEICDDGEDNDCDGLFDCLDDSCSEDVACVVIDETDYTCGDVNLDGTLNDSDVELVRAAILDGDLTPEQARRADLSREGFEKINVGVIGSEDLNLLTGYLEGGYTVECAETACNWQVWNWGNDDDGDGYHNILFENHLISCEKPENYVDSLGVDCLDTNSDVNPAGSEQCSDGLDNDCNDFVDCNDVACEEDDACIVIDDTDYSCGDVDLNGVVDAGDLTLLESARAGDASLSSEQARRADLSQNSGGNGIVNDADINILKPHVGGTLPEITCTDAETACTYLPHYRDGDSDGFGTAIDTIYACTVQTGYVSQPGDCTDTSALFSPALTEICNDAVDNNCDGVADCDDTQCSDAVECSGDLQAVEELSPFCGNGIKATSEACDDGNFVAGDGCFQCQIAPGWECTGNTCSSVCGNGIIAGGEQCDDDNSNPGDGCSSTCQLEVGWICTGEPSLCTITGPSPTVDTDGDGVSDSLDLCAEGTEGNVYTDGAAPGCMYGDLNGNSCISPGEVTTLVTSFIANYQEECVDPNTALTQYDGDLDGNGCVDPSDITSLVKNVIKNYDENCAE